MDLKTGRIIKTLQDHNSYVNSIVLSSDGSKIISSSLDKTIRIWDLETGQLIKTLQGGPTDAFTCIGTIFNTNFYSVRASDCYEISKVNLLQKCIENRNILNHEIEKREQDILHIEKDRNLFFKEYVDKMELENTDEKWEEEVKTLTGMIRKHNSEIKLIQLKINELETRVKIVDEKIFFFEIFQSDNNRKKNRKSSSSRMVLKNRKTGLILSFVE